MFSTRSKSLSRHCEHKTNEHIMQQLFTGLGPTGDLIVNHQTAQAFVVRPCMPISTKRWKVIVAAGKDHANSCCRRVKGHCTSRITEANELQRCLLKYTSYERRSDVLVVS